MPKKTRAQKQIAKLRRKLTQQQEASGQQQEIREKKIIKTDKTKTVTKTKESTYSPSPSYSHLTSDLKRTGVVTFLCLAILISFYLFV